MLHRSIAASMLVAAAAAAPLSGCAEPGPLDIDGPRSCEIPDQNVWVYDLMRSVYLWAPELPEVDPRSYESPAALISDLRYKPVDRWSRVSDRATSDALFQEGMVVGLGTRTLRDADARVFVSFVHPRSPAASAGIRRGDELLGLAGTDVAALDANDGWGAAFGPNEPGVTVAMEVRAPLGPRTMTGTEARTVTVIKDWYPVQSVVATDVIPTARGPVGHLVFTSFLETSETELDTAFATFAEAGVQQVVVDLRYNGGGRISTAHHFMELLVGDIARGDIAYSAEFEGRLEGENFTRRLDGGATSLQQLDHVAFITTGGSASASELLVNAVRSHTRVSIIGSTSAGKPVGSRTFKFCDKVAAPITFRLLNADGVSDYFEGIPATCQARDDLAHALGDTGEGSLRAALSVLENDVCPPLPDPPARRVQEMAPRSAPLRRQLPGNYPGIDALRGTY